MKNQKVCTTSKRKNATPYIQHGIMGRPLYVPLVLLVLVKNKLLPTGPLMHHASCAHSNDWYCQVQWEKITISNDLINQRILPCPKIGNAIPIGSGNFKNLGLSNNCWEYKKNSMLKHTWSIWDEKCYSNTNHSCFETMFFNIVNWLTCKRLWCHQLGFGIKAWIDVGC